MSKARPLGKDSGLCINVPCSYNKSFSSKAEPAFVMVSEQKCVTKIGYWHFVCMKRYKLYRILIVFLNLLWAIALLVNHPFYHLLHSVPATLLPFHNSMPKISSGRSLQLTEVWPIKFTRAWETNIYNLSTSQFQKGIKHYNLFYYYLTSQ